MRVAFFGTAEFSRAIFHGLMSSQDIDLVCTVSQPDSPAGRKQEIISTPLKRASVEAGVPCYQPEKIRKNIEFFDLLKTFDLDFIVVVAYGKILPKALLDIPKYGTINVHGSLLPKYRGASPIQESLKNGDSETGLTVMLMSEGMDEGDILSQAPVQIASIDNTKTIFAKFALLGPKLLYDTLADYMKGDIVPIEQDESQVTYCGKISKEDGLISFQTKTAKEIYHLFQAYYLWPGIYTFVDGKRLGIEDCSVLTDGSNDANKKYIVGQLVSFSKRDYGVICKEGILLLKQVKLEGKKSMDMLSFVNGNKTLIGAVFD